jgi:hypothetical protein
MISREQILNKLPPFYNRRDILVNDQDVSDIITGILTTHAQYANQYDKIAPYFIGSNNYQTGANIWHFLKNNVRYKVEPESMQMLKAPAAIVTEIINSRVNTSDCKNMSLFTGGILAAINRAGGRINWCYRFGSYKFLDKMPQHVFCVINPDTNKEIWIDAVLPTYNNKKQYYYKIDKTPKNMALISLAGTDDENIIGGKKRQAKRAAKKESKAAKKAANKEKRKNFFKKLKEKVKKAGKFVLKYNPATATSRNAFLLLTKVNTRSLATNLKKLKDKGNNEAQTFWTKIGGNVSALNNAIESGAKKKRLGVICGPVRRFQTSEVNESRGSKRDRSTDPKPKIQRFQDKPAMQNKLQRFADQQQSGARMRRLVEIKTVRRDAGGTEAALTAFVPTAVAPALQPMTRSGASPYSGGGGGYATNNEEETDLPIAKEEIDQDFLDNIDDDGNIIGEAGTATAAAIAAAAPIVAVIVKLLSKNKVSDPSEDKNLIDDVTAAGEEAGADAADDIEKEAQGIETPTGDKIIQGTKQQPAAAAAKKLPLMPILLVGGGLLAFTLLKKK